MFEKQNIVNMVGLGLRGAKTSIFTVLFCSDGLQKLPKHSQYDAFKGA